MYYNAAPEMRVISVYSLTQLILQEQLANIMTFERHLDVIPRHKRQAAQAPQVNWRTYSYGAHMKMVL